VNYEYLDSLHRRRRLYPARGPRRWTTLRQAWMADGLFDTFVLIVIESWLPREQQRPEYVRRCWSKVIAMLDQIERDVPGYGRLDIGQVRTIGALQFLQLKMAQVGAAAVCLDPAYDPFAGRPRTAAWFRAVSGATIFREPLIPEE
jgi:glutathione S-transferase